MFKRRASSAVILACASALALSACSGSSDASSSTSPASAKASASTSTAAIGGAKVKGATLAGQMMAAVVKAKSFEVTNDSPPSSQKSTSKVSVGADKKMAVAATYKVGANTVETVTLKNGATTYAKSSAMMLPKWTKLDPKSKDPLARKVASNVLNLTAPTAPWNAFSIVQQVELTKAGEETVNGVKATKYTADVPAKVVLNIAPPEQRQLLAGVLGDKTSPLVQYVDAAGRPVKQTLTMNLGAEQTISSSWSKFGTPVTVKAPI